MSDVLAAIHPPVSVVIVNWRAADETLAAVKDLQQQKHQVQCIYVVDNGSADGSLELLEAAFAGMSDIKLLANPKNLGFGGGCNRALEEAISDGCSFIWLLNNDARPAPDCLSALLATAARDANIGMVGSWLSDPDQPRQDHSGSWMRPWLLSCGSVQTPDDLERHPFSWVTAASALIRAETLAKIGLFDEEFFMYWEDADLAMRIRYAGYQIAIARNALVVHRAGTSSADIPVQRYLWHLRSQGLWLNKHHPSPAVATFLLKAKFLAKALMDRDLERFKGLLKSMECFHW